MSEEISKINAVILNGEENFGVWSFQIRTILDGINVLEVVDGTVVKTDIIDQHYQTKLTAFIKKKKKARQILATTIHPSLVKHIMYCRSSKKMWDKLHEIFQQKSQMSRHMLLKSFFNYSKDPMDSIADHIAKLEDICERLAVLGEKISKTMLIVLMSLPSVYNHFHAAWDSVDPEEQTIENLRTRLMTEEARIELESCNLDKDIVLVMRGNHSKVDSSKICYYCKEPGHWKKDCEKLKLKLHIKEHSNAF